MGYVEELALNEMPKVVVAIDISKAVEARVLIRHRGAQHRLHFSALRGGMLREISNCFVEIGHGLVKEIKAVRERNVLPLVVRGRAAAEQGRAALGRGFNSVSRLVDCTADDLRERFVRELRDGREGRDAEVGIRGPDAVVTSDAKCCELLTGISANVRVFRMRGM